MIIFQNPVNKNDYLGEYTGELISHREADKRGKIYDRANSSFLFDLNEQVYVLHDLHFALTRASLDLLLIDLSSLYFDHPFFLMYVRFHQSSPFPHISFFASYKTFGFQTDYCET